MDRNTLFAENACLREENERLRADNARLEKALAEKKVINIAEIESIIDRRLTARENDALRTFGAIIKEVQDRIAEEMYDLEQKRDAMLRKAELINMDHVALTWEDQILDLVDPIQ